MDPFEAEAKRTWFTLRETLGNATLGGRLWTPATVAINENLVRVATSEESIELRPRRIAWTAPDSFRVTGLSRSMAFRRTSLRFKSSEQASLAASIIRRNPRVFEELLVPVEEYSVQVRYLLTAVYVIVQFYVFLFRLFIVGIFLIILDEFGTFGLIFGTAIGMFYLGLFFLNLIVKNRRRILGWLRFQGKSVAVRTSVDWIPVRPKIIEGRSPQVIVLSGRGTKIELTFPIPENLTRAVTRIRTAYPRVQEISVSTYKIHDNLPMAD